MDKQAPYIVKTEIFEGPLDLLLHLIEKRKLLINDVSLAQITDDYIGFIKNSNVAEVRSDSENGDDNEVRETIGVISIKERAQFILVASTLLLIKSKSILPTLDLTDEEQESIEDLETRLKIYKRMKDVEPFVLERFGKNISFMRQEPKKNETVVFTPKENMIKENFFTLMIGVLKNLPKTEIRPKAILQKVISLEETILNLTKRVTANLSMSFREFSNFGKAEKVNIIVGFLAMLELVKQGALEVQQDSKFGDIDMHTKSIDTPQYQ